MSNISEDILMAYADGELDPPERAAERAAVEAAMQSDTTIARRIEHHQALRRQLGSLYADTLQQSVPERLVAAARLAPETSAASNVAYLERSRSSPRSSRTNRSVTDSVDRHNARKYWPWAAVAATLVIGLIGGYVGGTWRAIGPISVNGGNLIARTYLDRALTSQLSADPVHTHEVQIGLSFKSKSGQYCRTFTLSGSQPIAGLACRQVDAWRIQTLALTQPIPGSDTGYRPAASTMSAAVRAAAEAQIAGDPLDARGELQARQNRWLENH